MNRRLEGNSVHQARPPGSRPVGPAKAARGSEKPVSVSEAKEAKARKAATASKRGAEKADEEEAEAPAKPARRRKTA